MNSEWMLGITIWLTTLAWQTKMLHIVKNIHPGIPSSESVGSKRGQQAIQCSRELATKRDELTTTYT